MRLLPVLPHLAVFNPPPPPLSPAKTSLPRVTPTCDSAGNNSLQATTKQVPTGADLSGSDFESLPPKPCQFSIKILLVAVRERPS